MLDSIRRYQQHRIFELILHNINFHLYLTTVATLLLLLLLSFSVAATFFLTCLLISLIYNLNLYRIRKGNYHEAAIHLDRELNGKDMFITLLEYPTSSENLMLRLLHDRAETVSRNILNQDFETQDKQLLNKTLFAFLAVCLGFFLLFLLLNSFDSNFSKNNSKHPTNVTHQTNVTHKKNSSTNPCDVEKKTSPKNTSVNNNSNGSKCNNAGLNSTSLKKNSLKQGSKAGSNPKKTGVKASNSQNMKPPKSEKNLRGKTPQNSENNAKSSRLSQENIKKNENQNPSFKPKEDIRKSSDSNLDISNHQKKPFRKTTPLQKDPLSKSEQDRKRKIKKSAVKTDSGSFTSGELGGKKVFEKIKFKDQKDIQNNSYKRQKDELEQVLNNPRMPKSYKAILKRFYSSEKK